MDAYETKLVTNNIALARFLARKTWERAPGALDLDEVTSLAYKGLVDAALRYKSYGQEHGYAPASYETGEFFSSFARRRIVGNILDAYRASDHVPRGYRKDYRLLLSAGYLDGLSHKELSLKTGLSVERIKKTIHLINSAPISLEGHFSVIADEGESRSLVAATSRDIASETDVEGSALVADIMKRGLVDVVSSLDESQQLVVILRYYGGLDLRSIADQLGLNITIVREQHSEALLLIRESMLHLIKAAS